MRVVLVSGGVISGVGKGEFLDSLIDIFPIVCLYRGGLRYVTISLLTSWTNILTWHPLGIIGMEIYEILFFRPLTNFSSQ
jgi:hypothetical protein